MMDEQEEFNEEEKAGILLDEHRWIGELNAMYWKILKDPSIDVENLDKANDVICATIEKLRPLTK